MTNWQAIATKNLVSQSVKTTDFDIARKEWYVTEKVIDSYVSGCATLPACELCHHEKIRWQFEIQNKINKNTLLVGSTCITKFDIPATNSEATFFHGKIRDKLLAFRVQTIKNQYIKDHISVLLNQSKNTEENNKTIQEIEIFWTAHNCFTPKMAFDFVNICTQNKIDIQEIEINVTLRKIDYRLEILHMKVHEYKLIVPYLDKNQKATCNNIRREKD